MSTVSNNLGNWEEGENLVRWIPQKFGIGGAKLEAREERDSDSKFGTFFHITITPIVFVTLCKPKDSLYIYIYIYIYTRTRESSKLSINPFKINK